MNDRNQRFAYFRHGVDAIESSPDKAGQYQVEQEMRQMIGEAVDALAKFAREHGMNPCNCDGIHNVESTIYAWLTKGTTVGAAVEGFGKYGLRQNEGDES